MTGPGTPLGPINLRWQKLPGRDLYFNLDTGETTNRTGYRNIIAQKYGFRNSSDYDRFSSQLNGIGGLGGLRVKDVQRARNIVRKYERDHGMPRGSFGIQGNFIQATRVRDWLTEPPGEARNRLLMRMFDAMGVPRPKYKYAPGDSPKI